MSENERNDTKLMSPNSDKAVVVNAENTRYSEPPVEPQIVVNNRFANDGSFLQMFKQMQQNSNQNPINKNTEEQRMPSVVELVTTDGQTDGQTSADRLEVNPSGGHSSRSATTANKPFVNINKRKNLKRLKTGVIKKSRNESSGHSSGDDSNGHQTDPWNRYMREVRKYKEKYGDDNDKNRPLVK